MPATAYKIQDLPKIHNHCFTFAPGEVYTEDSGDINMGLHAKMYLGLRADGTGTDVFLGSANCTTNGLSGLNTEAMMRFECPKSNFRDFLANFFFQDMKKEIAHEWLRKFKILTAQELNAAKEEAAKEQVLSDARAALAAGQFRLRIQGKRASLRFLRPASFSLAPGVRVKVAPWGCPHSKELTACI